ncbi:aminotransferase class I/II-fold pyridoxal phosphate-dependent enzyme [Tepidimonas charontis]|uniref:histidinol-phosphate transaminase n=1 Tax=Tepidimonas charontis TaxID=2267262 RepID=A0A554XKX4_9BURK|nr:aminotransferase class I/II-fold pyridoxal phosphate-dependent enzyme [Tepidimonas charontis]TSE36485.1 Histidinol-phosphate aminotransferase [Tepidimonas charontis]
MRGREAWVRIHGGPDVHGAVPWDFSTNANACGPCPTAWQAVQQADATRYPDPSYTELRRALADWHGVIPERVLVLGSASEGIQRLTAAFRLRGARHVHLPRHGYGDYRHAARAWGLCEVKQPAHADLVWLCDPGSPQGQPQKRDVVEAALQAPSERSVVLDAAYAPLRLYGADALTKDELRRVWQIWTPNKALGMTGVRAAYAIAPEGAEEDVTRMEALAPSWPVGAHGVALLRAWVQPQTQRWLADSRQTLAAWAEALRARLEPLGWICAPSVTPFFCARPPQPLDAAALRTHGVRLRDATSFGLPGWWRMSAQPPQAVDALVAAWQAAISSAPREACATRAHLDAGGARVSMDCVQHARGEGRA